MEQLKEKSVKRKNPSSEVYEVSTILVVEDHEEIAFGLKNNLEFDGHEVAIAGDGQEGLQLLKQRSIDLIILDLMLPGMSGYDFLETVREGGNSVPVLILSAKGEEIDKVRGFRLGADDYVTKPFGTIELIARIEAILRRTGKGKDTDELWKFGDIEVDADKRTVRKNDNELSLTPLEFELLQALLKRRGAVASRKELLEEIWNHPDNVMTRTVDTHIAELRNKLEDTPSKPEYILTVPKIGYKLKI
jgi:DNA-binding response OmpR family regulator